MSFEFDWDYFKKHYVFKKWIFRGAVLVSILFLLLVIVFEGSQNRYYYKCDVPGGCYLKPIQNELCIPHNSFLDKIKYPGLDSFLWSSGLCSQDFVLPGVEFGQPPGALQSSAGFILSLLFLAAFILNHLMYNRRFKFENQ